MMAPAAGPGGRLASIRFRAGIGGEPILQEMQASEAVEFQPAPWGAWIVTSATHPVPGDHHVLKVATGVGCCAEMRSLGAVVAGRPEGRPAQGCPADGRPDPNRPAESGETVGSSLTVNATVASDAMLTWVPDPGLATEGCDHRHDSLVQLASSARLLWRDEFMVGRRCEGRAGTWRSRLRVARDGWPVVSSELAVGTGSPLWGSPAVLNGARAVSFMVVVDPGQPSDAWSSARARTGSATGVALPLSAPGLQLVAWGDDLMECRAAIDSMLDAGGVPPWAAVRWNGRRPMERATPGVHR